MATKKFYHDIDLVSVGQLLNARLHNVDNSGRATLAATPLTVDHKGLQVWDTDDNAPYIWNGTAWVRDALVVTGDVVFRGTVDASGSLDAQATAAAGNQYVVSVGGNPLMTGVTFTPDSAVEPGDVILFTSSNAATVLQRNLEDAIVDADFTEGGLMTTDGSGNYTVTTNNSNNWNTAYGWGDHSTEGYLTSEANDLTASVTWANVPDANITESSVTQHQGALSITESQISDLGSYLTAETNDLTASVTWANVPDANITESSVTQHQGALSITESQISDLQSYLLNITGENIQDLANVTITAAATGDFLRYDGSAWVDSTIQDSDIGESAVTQHQGALSITESQISDLQSYLTAETNDLTASVTWANVPDANITESSVTQHQGALSITESQISDLQSYLTAETNDLTASVTWANVPDANITESSVTQHEGALSINESQITFTSSFIDLTDISVGSNATASGSGGIAYNNTTGVFTYTPPDLSGITTNTNAIGTLSSLATADKTNLVAAINEIHGALPKTYFNGNVTLTADSPVTINHALDLTNKDSYVITIADTNGSQVSVDIDSTDVDNLTITSSIALTGIKVAIIGF